MSLVTSAMAGSSEEWEEKFHSGKQKKYWKNKATGKSTWNDPTKGETKSRKSVTAAGAAESTTANDEWEEKFSSQHNKPYWKNKSTGKTTWKEPPGWNKSTNVEATGISNSVKKTASALKQERSEVGTTDDWEWEEKFHAGKQRKYWKNLKTGKSTWTEPPRPAVSTSLSAEVSDSTEGREEPSPWGDEWKEMYSAAKKKKYWKNLKTGKSQWTEPPRVAEANGHDNEARKTSQEENHDSKYSEVIEKYDKMKNDYTDLENELAQAREETKDYRSTAQESLDEMERKLRDHEEEITKLTSMCDLYKRSHEEAEKRFEEAISKQQLTAADVASLQEQHENSIRKLNAELEISIIREKTKGENSVFDVTRELNEIKLRNDALEIKCNMLAAERDDISQKLEAEILTKCNAESAKTDTERICEELSLKNEQHLHEISLLNDRINELTSQNSNNIILIDEYKQNNSDINAKYAEEKVKLTMQLEEKTSKLEKLEDRCEELESSNHKLMIERDLLKQMSEEAEDRRSSKYEDIEGSSSIEEIKTDFSNKIRKLNAEMEIKLLEEKANGEKNNLEVKREYNDLKTLHEQLTSRYNALVDEKKMNQAEIDHAKAYNRDLREEKEKLIEALRITRNSGHGGTAAPPPPPPRPDDKLLLKIKDYEFEIDDLQRKYQNSLEQLDHVSAQRDEYKNALREFEEEKSGLEASLGEKDGVLNKLIAEKEMYKNKYEESEIRFHVWENENESSGKILTQSMKELQMLHESQKRKLQVEFDIQLIEERSKGEQKLFAAVSKLNSLKVNFNQIETEAKIKYDALLAEKESIETAFNLLKQKEKRNAVKHQNKSEKSKNTNRLSQDDATLLKSQLFQIINKFDDNTSTPPDSPPPDDGLDVVYDDDDTPPDSPPSSDDDD